MKHDSNPRIRLLLADVYLRAYKYIYKYNITVY